MVAEFEPEFSELDIVMAQQLDYGIKLDRYITNKWRTEGFFVIDCDGYPLDINKPFVEALHRIVFERFTYFVDQGHGEVAKDIVIANMQSDR